MDNLIKNGGLKEAQDKKNTNYAIGADTKDNPHVMNLVIDPMIKADKCSM